MLLRMDGLLGKIYLIYTSIHGAVRNTAKEKSCIWYGGDESTDTAQHTRQHDVLTCAHQTYHSQQALAAGGLLSRYGES